MESVGGFRMDLWFGEKFNVKTLFKMWEQSVLWLCVPYWEFVGTLQEYWLFHDLRKIRSLGEACCLQEDGFNILNFKSFEARLYHQCVAKDELTELW